MLLIVKFIEGNNLSCQMFGALSQRMSLQVLLGYLLCGFFFVQFIYIYIDINEGLLLV